MNLRLLLASFGLVVCAVLTAGLLWTGNRAFAVVTGLLALISLIDLVVVQLRRSRTKPGEPGRSSLFG